jgi:hypothetical protein
MFRSAVILAGVFACEIGLPGDFSHATAGPEVSEWDKDPAGQPVPDVPSAGRCVTIAVPQGDCGCNQSPSAGSPATRLLSVRLVDSVALPPKTRDALADEVIRFTRGRRIDASEPVHAESVGNADAVYVLLRPGAAPAHARSPSKRAARPDDAPLAWTVFQQDRPSSHIFIWVGAVQRLLHRSSIEGRPFTHWHADLRHALLARALGRVAAHELGHLMCGRQHAGGGLMRRRFSADDLLWNTTGLATNEPDGTCRHLTPH